MAFSDARNERDRADTGRNGTNHGGGNGNGGAGPQGRGRTDGRRAGPQGRATPDQVAGNACAGVSGAGRGWDSNGNRNHQSAAEKAISGALNPVTEDPVLNAFLSGMPVVGPVMRAVGALRAMGVPNTPANTSPAYKDAQRRANGGVGQAGQDIGDIASNTMANALPPKPIGFRTQHTFTSDGAPPQDVKIPIFPKATKPVQQQTQFPNAFAPSQRIVKGGY